MGRLSPNEGQVDPATAVSVGEIKKGTETPEPRNPRLGRFYFNSLDTAVSIELALRRCYQESKANPNDRADDSHRNPPSVSRELPMNLRVTPSCLLREAAFAVLLFTICVLASATAFAADPAIPAG